MKKSLVLIAALAAAALCATAHAFGVDASVVPQAVAHYLPQLATPEAAMTLAALGAFGTTKAVQDGKVMDWVNGTGSAVASGDVVKIGNILGVALVDIANGATGSVQVRGVFTVPKVTAAVIAQGESLTWDVSAGKFDDNAATPATGDVTGPPAVAYEAGTSSMTTLKVMFTGVPGTVT